MDFFAETLPANVQFDVELTCRRSSLAEINRELYCGWADAECGAASAPSRGDESTPGSTMKGVAGDSQSTDTASFGSREGGGTAGSRRALKSFGSHPSLGMPGEVGDAQAGVQFGGSSKEESRVLAKVDKRSFVCLLRQTRGKGMLLELLDNFMNAVPAAWSVQSSCCCSIHDASPPPSDNFPFAFLLGGI
eukprot:scaffold24617_cov22-Tisochrysis_lutea.AAC.2